MKERQAYAGDDDGTEHGGDESCDSIQNNPEMAHTLSSVNMPFTRAMYDKSLTSPQSSYSIHRYYCYSYSLSTTHSPGYLDRL